MKKKLNLLILLLSMLMVSIVTPTTIPIVGTVESVSAAIRISNSKATLIVGQTKQLKITGTKTKPKWTTSRKSVATVTSSGKVTAKSKGSTTITAKVGKKSYKCKITVQKPYLSKNSVSLVKGKTYNLKMYGTTLNVRWMSSNSKIATVSSSGKISAKITGRCTIYGIVSGKKFACKITVKNPTQPQNQKPLLIDSGWGISRSNEDVYVSYGVVIKNPNDVYMEYPTLNITATDASGRIIAVEEQVFITIAPKDTIQWAFDFDCHGITPSNVSFSVSCSKFTNAVNTIATDKLVIMNTSEREEPEILETYFTGELQNNSPKHLDTVALSIIYRNNGKIVGGTTEFIDDVYPYARRTFQTSDFNAPEHNSVEYFAQSW